MCCRSVDGNKGLLNIVFLGCHNACNANNGPVGLANKATDKEWDIQLGLNWFQGKSKM